MTQSAKEWVLEQQLKGWNNIWENVTC
jgi:hypothetical protein